MMSRTTTACEYVRGRVDDGRRPLTEEAVERLALRVCHEMEWHPVMEGMMMLVHDVYVLTLGSRDGVIFGTEVVTITEELEDQSRLRVSNVFRTDAELKLAKPGRRGATPGPVRVILTREALVRLQSEPKKGKPFRFSDFLLDAQGYP